MKHWLIDYSIRIDDTGEVEELDMTVEALNIVDAISTASHTISEQPLGPGLTVVIWHAGIMEENVF